MATPFQLTEQELSARGSTWFACLAGKGPEAAIAKSALDKRNYSAAPKSKGKSAPTQSQGALGQHLFDAFDKARNHKGSAKLTASAEALRAEQAALALRAWIRRHHGVALALRRSAEHPPAELVQLPALGELTDDAQLEASAKALLGWLARPAPAAAMADYGFAPSDLAEGHALLAAWKAVGRALTVARGTRGAASAGGAEAREAFRSWLARWWGLASADLAEQPAVLRALGIEVGALKPRGPAARKDAKNGKNGNAPGQPALTAPQS